MNDVVPMCPLEGSFVGDLAKHVAKLRLLTNIELSEGLRPLLQAPRQSHLDAILEQLGGHHGPSRGILGPVWPYSDHQGQCWGYLEASGANLERILGPSAGLVRQSWAIWASPWGLL